MIALPGFKAYPFQQTIHKRIISQTERHQLIAGPTGTGKSYNILMGHSELYPKSWVVTPRIEILAGLLDKCGIDFASDAELVDKAYALQITTPIRFRNKLFNGEIHNLPDRLFIDETHHESAESYQQLITCLPNDCKLTGLTATPFRGTPKQTHEFLQRWGQPFWGITYKEAIKQRYLSFPVCDTWGLIDDDLIEIGSNGDFVINRLNAAVNDKMHDALRKTKEYGLWNPDGTPRRPMLITIPSSGVIDSLYKAAKDLGLKIACITDETAYMHRQRMFAGCIRCMFAIAHINTVSEGVDLPIRIQVDLSPTLSPVMFCQRIGRITRPVERYEDLPEYICTNRNLERHGYIFDGVMPPSMIAKSQKAFENPSERIGFRAFGLTSLGRLHGFRMRLTNDLQVTCYNVTQMDGHKKLEYFVIAHPSYAKPLFFHKQSTRINVVEDKTQYDWGKWELMKEPPTELTGFKSSQARLVTDAQKNQWDKWADKVGLDSKQTLNTRNIQCMFILRDAKVKLE